MTKNKQPANKFKLGGTDRLFFAGFKYEPDEEDLLKIAKTKLHKVTHPAIDQRLNPDNSFTISWIKESFGMKPKHRDEDFLKFASKAILDRLDGIKYSGKFPEEEVPESIALQARLNMASERLRQARLPETYPALIERMGDLSLFGSAPK